MADEFTEDTEPSLKKAWRTPGLARKHLLELLHKNTKTCFELSDGAEQLRQFGLEPVAFLNSLGVPEADSRVYASLDGFFRDDRAALVKARVSFDVLKALTFADDETRSAAIKKLRSGDVINLPTVDALASENRRNANDHVVIFERGQEMFRDILIEKAEFTRKEFVEHSIDLLESMLNFERSTDIEQIVQRDVVINLAKALLVEFEQLFGADFAPVEDWFKIGMDDKLPQKFAEAQYALRELSEGNFTTNLPMIDPRSFRGPDLFAQSLLPKWTALESISFLAGRVLPIAQSAQLREPYSPKLTAIELCAGIGGLALGLEAAGFTFKGVYERDPVAAQIIGLNRKSWEPAICDIEKDRDKLFKDIVHRLTDKDGNRVPLDLVSGALPWAHWLKKGKGLNHRNDLFEIAKDIVSEFRPRAFLFETATELGENFHDTHRNRLFAEFAALEYKVDIFRPSAQNLGIPQARKKIYVVGILRQFAPNLKLLSTQRSQSRSIWDVLSRVVFPDRTTPSRFVIQGKMSEKRKRVDQKEYDVRANGWMETAKKSFEVPDLSRGLNNWVAERVKISANAAQNKRRGRGRPREHEIEPHGKLQPDRTLRETWWKLGFEIMDRQEAFPKDPMSREKVPLTPAILVALQGLPTDWRLSGTLGERIALLCEATPPIIAFEAGRLIYGALVGHEREDNLSMRLRPSECSSFSDRKGRRLIVDKWKRNPFVVPPPNILGSRLLVPRIASAWHRGIVIKREGGPKFEYDDEYFNIEVAIQGHETGTPIQWKWKKQRVKRLMRKRFRDWRAASKSRVTLVRRLG